jgi:hypothetical protein
VHSIGRDALCMAGCPWNNRLAQSGGHRGSPGFEGLIDPVLHFNDFTCDEVLESKV